MRKIGIFGGSFDPPHLGHDICSKAVAKRLDLEKILIVPTAIQPCKPTGSSASIKVRWDMVKLWAETDELFIPSRLEIDRGGISYTLETLKLIKKDFPSTEYKLYLIIGYDAALEIKQWKNLNQIARLVQLVVMRRKTELASHIPEKWFKKMIFIDTPIVNISSTQIRDRIKEIKPVKNLIFLNVFEYIEKNNLYL